MRANPAGSDSNSERRIWKIAFACFPLPGNSDSIAAMDGERKRGADLIVVVIGWDGMGFTLLRGWGGILGKGRKRKRKRNSPIGEKRPSVPNRETVKWQCIHGVFPRFERGEFYRFERRILKRFLSWDWIGFDSVTNSPPQPTLSNGLARGIRKPELRGTMDGKRPCPSLG